MAVKMLMYWDILPSQEKEYFEFVVREFIPGMQGLGLEPSDAWLTMYGEKPQIVAAMLSPNLASLQRIMASSEWIELTQRLHDYVENFSYKVVKARNGFQL